MHDVGGPAAEGAFSSPRGGELKFDKVFAEGYGLLFSSPRGGELKFSEDLKYALSTICFRPLAGVS